VLFLADGLVVGRLHDADATAIAAAMSELER
jgi:putative ABC transport system ATP-binding protein